MPFPLSVIFVNDLSQGGRGKYGGGRGKGQ